MPKEIIRNASQFGDDDQFHVEVRWGRDGDLQVATVKENDPPGSGDVQGWFVNLDRNGVNDLIRVLRRARDAAYGRDE